MSAPPSMMRTPGGFLLAPGTKLPDSWAKVGEVDINGRAINRPWDADINVVEGPEGLFNPEKAAGVATNAGGRDVLILGAGARYTEEMKEEAARIIEERSVEIEQERAAREEQYRLEALKHFDQKLDNFKRNQITHPDPGHTRDWKGKRFH